MTDSGLMNAFYLEMIYKSLGMEWCRDFLLIKETNSFYSLRCVNYEVCFLGGKFDSYKIYAHFQSVKMTYTLVV